MKSISALVVAGSLMAYAGFAQSHDLGLEWSGSVDFTTNYVWRGVSQTRNGAAVQGSIGVAHESGLYANIWGSNVHFGAPGGATDAALELDGTVGFGHTFSNGIGADIAYVRYIYPRSNAMNLDFSEGQLGLSWNMFNARVSHSNDVFNTGGDGTYYNVGFSYDLPANNAAMEDVAIGASVGHYNFDSTAATALTIGDYNDYKVSLSKVFFKKVKGEVAYTNTNDKFVGNALDKSHVIGTIHMDV